jgi:serine/threonine-protein kinase SRPK3
MNNFDGWTESEIYKCLGQPRMATLRLLSGAPAGVHGPKKIVEAIRYSNMDNQLLTGNVRIIDFGESFFLSKPQVGLLGIPAAYFAPETLFGWSASAASDVWALACLIYEVLTMRPLICIFFGRLDEALSEVVQTLGPFPRAWQDCFFDKSYQKAFEPGKNHPWFDSSDLRHPLESLVRNIKPQLTVKEIDSLLDLLEGALAYEPINRLSAEQIARHAWFAD